ncbi:MAG: LuxR C-terminal-related transcriptional regulator [Micromonosporaceae bacterium]
MCPGAGDARCGHTEPGHSRELFITLDTVKRHVSHVLGKLGAANRTEAVARGCDLGLIPSTRRAQVRRHLRASARRRRFHLAVHVRVTPTAGGGSYRPSQNSPQGRPGSPRQRPPESRFPGARLASVVSTGWMDGRGDEKSGANPYPPAEASARAPLA